MKNVGSGLASFCLLILFFSFPWHLRAQDSIKIPGAVTTVNRNGQDLDIRTEHAWVRLTVYCANMIRVRLSDHPLGIDHSYAVVTTPCSTGFEWHETPSEIRIRTDSLDLRVQRAPFAISFYTPDGRIINEDEKG